MRLTVPDQATAGQDLHLLASGSILTAPFTTHDGFITAGNNVLLQVGDNVTTTDAGAITAGYNVTVYGDFGNADAGVGTTMNLRGSITPGSGETDRTAFFGNSDDDTFTFNRTALGGETFAYGSTAPTPAGTAPMNDGQDTFTVNQLGTMSASRPYTGAAGTINRRDTLDLDGQAGTDVYLVNTTGSESPAPSDYVINVLDTGAPADGADTLTVNGSAGADLFLLRKADSVVGRPNAIDPAFVALLHGTLGQAQGHTLGSSVERINYDANVNSLNVNALGGDDSVAGDDNSTATTIDGGAGNDTFQIGQVFGSTRVPSDVAAADQFSTILTTRGYLSSGVSSPTAIRGGTGDDTFQVYSNRAELQLAGEDGNDTFILRAFALPGGGYNLNAPVAIDGGNGIDSTVVLGTEADDAFAITPTGVFGAGLNVTHGATETLEVNALEGNDTFFVLGTRSGLATALVAGAGSDAVNVSGDVTLPVVSGLVPVALPAATHTTDQIQGPVVIEGFNGDAPVRTIAPAIILPTEHDAGPFAFPPPPADDRSGIDRVNVFNDRSTTSDSGTLTGTSLSGLNIASGVTYRAVEVLDVLLGTNDDTFTINGTLTADGVQNPSAPQGQQGGITLVQGGGGNDTITVNGGGGPTSPLVIFGDTAQDGREYSGTVGTLSPYGTAYPAPGDDVIDARNAALGIIAYGGRGNDTIYGSQGDDLIAGGSGNDVLFGRGGNDIVHGDDGINIDLVTRSVTVPTIVGTIFPTGDNLAAGVDQITGDAGFDILFGDHGIVNQTAGTLPALTNGNVTRVATTNAADGGADTIDGGADNDLVLGGAGSDSITDASGENVLFGDFLATRLRRSTRRARSTRNWAATTASSRDSPTRHAATSSSAGRGTTRSRPGAARTTSSSATAERFSRRRRSMARRTSQRRWTAT